MVELNQVNKMNKIDEVLVIITDLFMFTATAVSLLISYFIHSLTTSIDKIKEFEDNKLFYELNFLIEFVNKYKCHLLFIIPLHNYNKDPQLLVNLVNIKIIYFDSYYEFNGNGIDDTRIKWNKVAKIVLELYNFNIEDK